MWPATGRRGSGQVWIRPAPRFFHSITTKRHLHIINWLTGDWRSTATRSSANAGEMVRGARRMSHLLLHVFSAEAPLTRCSPEEQIIWLAFRFYRWWPWNASNERVSRSLQTRRSKNSLLICLRLWFAADSRSQKEENSNSHTHPKLSQTQTRRLSLEAGASIVQK